MRRFLVILCIGALLVTAFLPGVITLSVTLTELCDVTPRLDQRGARDTRTRPAVAPALRALVLTQHAPRACLFAIGS